MCVMNSAGGMGVMNSAGGMGYINANRYSSDGHAAALHSYLALLEYQYYPIEHCQ